MNESNSNDAVHVSLGTQVLGAIFCLLVMYVAFFVAICLDEFVFRTFWIHQMLPGSAHAPIRTIYSPVLKLLNW